MRKGRARKVFVFVILFCFILTSILVFVPRDENKPPTEDPIATDLKPVNPEPTQPEEPDKPDPVKPKLNLVSFSEKGEAEPSSIETSPGGNAEIFLFCKLPPGTKIVLDMEAELKEGWTIYVGKPNHEPGLTVKTDIYDIVLLGITPTAELRTQLDETYDAGSGKTSVKIEPGTILGTVGSGPSFKNDWEVEGCNLIIDIGIYSDHIDLIEPSVAAIMEAITH